MATAGAAIASAVTAAETITAAAATRQPEDITAVDKPCALAAVAAECMLHQRAATAAVADTPHLLVATAAVVADTPRLRIATAVAVVDTRVVVVVVDIRAAVAVAAIRVVAAVVIKAAAGTSNL